MNKKAITQIQAVLIVAIIGIAAIAGVAYYATLPGEEPTPTPTPTPTTPPTEFSLTIAANMGTVDPGVGSHDYEEGEEVTVSWSGDGMAFDRWELNGNVVGSSPTYAVTMDSDNFLQAIALNVIQIVFIAEGDLLDGSFYEAQSNDLTQLANDRKDIEVTYAEQTTVPDFAGVATGFAEEGYELIIAGSFSYREGAITVAASYSDTWFAIQGGDVGGDNILSINTWPHEANYLEGIIAGMMTETDIVGTIGSFPFPTTNAAINGFDAGLRSVNENITHLIAWTFDFFDPAGAYEIAAAQFEAGADIIIGQGSGNVLGCFDAAKDLDFYTFGMILDQNYLAPDHILTSGMQRYYSAFESIADLLIAGELEGRTYGFFMAEGAASLAPFIDAVPQDVQDAVAAAEEQIILGNLVVPINLSEYLG